MDLSERTSSALIDRANSDIAQLIRRFENIIAYATEQKGDRNKAAVESFQLSVETAALTKAAEDILSLTRVLKEAWFFGKLQTVGTSAAEQKAEDTSAQVFDVLDRLRASGAFDVVTGEEEATHVNGNAEGEEKEV